MAVKLGYPNVYRLAHGIPALIEMGLPLESEDALSAVPGERQGIGIVFSAGLLLTLLGVFLGGIALNLTPCVYPLIPITASYFGGRSDAGERQGHLLVHGFLYILGLAVMNSAVGVSAAFTGRLMGSFLQHPAVLIFVSAVMLLMALSFFGLWEIRLPGFLRSAVSKSPTGYAQSFFMGLTLGIVAAPCIGPFIIGLLTMVAQRGDPLFGFLVFFTLSVGLGLPLLVLSIFAGNLSRLPRSGEWLLWIRMLFGWTMLAMAVYFVKPLIPWHDAGTCLLSLIGLAAAVHLGFTSGIGGNQKSFVRIKRVFGVLLIGLSVFLAASHVLRGPGVAWQAFSEDAYAKALTAGKPMIVDFYADWCTPCRELETKTFHDKVVVKESERFSMIKVDLTREAGPSVTRFLRRHDVRGVPTVIFLDREGNEIRALRLVDYVPGGEFLPRMKAVPVL